MLVTQNLTINGFIIQSNCNAENLQTVKPKKGAKGTKGALMQLKKRAIDESISNKVQRALDTENSILIAKNEIQVLKQKTKNARAMFAAKRKGLI